MKMVFLRDRHIKFFQRCLKVLPSASVSMDEMRMTIAYFAISGLDLLNALDTLEDKEDIIEWIYSLQVLPSPDGSNLSRCGFRGSPASCVSKGSSNTGELHRFDGGHIAMTYTALVTLIILGDDLSRVNKAAITSGLKALQQKCGSFCAALDGSEDDMRFLYCGACISYILQDWSGFDMERAAKFITDCYCYDGGISAYPGTEGHGGPTFCAVASLVLMGRLHSVFSHKQLDRLRRWCLLRQQTGFQGRPNKPVDTCYSFWVGAALQLLGAYQFVQKEKNFEFLESTQDVITGGFSKWPDSDPDPMHSYLGLAGLSLMGVEGVAPLEPALNVSQRAASHLRQLHRDTS
ncbi:geranylgeranyl transferase type-1 subunit beta-like [Ornithodoros turicata]|uniref:geranylgeranyl transferase type-1 subunit beta-like n=1 Tax=Ornithodoros turicata TaxID=34597 RepID=UPI003139681F